MTTYAVRLIGANDPRGRPEGSVADAQVLKDGQTCGANRTEMTEEELDELRATHATAVASSVVSERLVHAKQNECRRLKVELTSYIETCYSDAQQRTLTILYQEAVAEGYANRQALIQEAINWIKKAVLHYYSKRDEVLATSTVEAARAVAIDIATLRSTNPRTSIEDVIALNS